jgi:AbrB family looped-hinge helix DNA binding protein
MKQVYHATLGAGGRLVIPAGLRQTLRLKEGDAVVLETDGETVRLASQEKMFQEIQAFFRQGIPEGVSLVEELLAERREEARREEEESRD